MCCLMHEDNHPHLALEPLFLAMTHRNIDLMRLLVDCSPHIPVRVTKILKAILKSSRDLAVHYSQEMKRQLLAFFDANINQPKSLQDICRRRIRASLGSLLHMKADALPVGEKIKDYIVMKDVFEGWEETDRLEEELKTVYSVAH